METLAVAMNTFRESLRNKILYSVLLFAALLLAGAAFFGTVSIGDRVQVIKDFGLFSLSFFGAILVIVSGVSLINKELKQRTLYNILSKSVSRRQFVTGKFLGLLLTVAALLALMGLSLFGFVGMLERHSDPWILVGTLFAILEAVVMAAVVVFFSSITVTTTLTGIFSLCTYIAGHSIRYLLRFTSDAELANPALERLIKVFSWILPDLSLFNVNSDIVYGVPVTPSHIAAALLYSFGYALVLVVLAGIIFQRRELI